MAEARPIEPSVAEDPARMREQIEALNEEVLRLQRKLGELHGGDYNALRRAYVALSQHVSALEQEARGMLGQLREFETEAVPAELVAKELGVAALVGFGVALLHTTIRSLPFKQPAALGKGLVLLGGAYVLARLTGGALAHVAGMFGRNAGRKRRLMRQLQAVEERISIMMALQQWAERQTAAAAGAEAGGEGAGEGSAAAAAAAGEEETLAVLPPRRVSPAVSSGSSAELVEMPRAEELEAVEAGEAGELPSAAAGTGRPSSRGSNGGGSGSGSGAGSRRASSSSSALAGLLAYAELGQRR